MSFFENFLRASRQAIEEVSSSILEANLHLSCYGTFLCIRERIVSHTGDGFSRAKEVPLLEPKYLKPMTDDERINIKKILAFEELADFSPQAFLSNDPPTPQQALSILGKKLVFGLCSDAYG